MFIAQLPYPFKHVEISRQVGRYRRYRDRWEDIGDIETGGKI
jgi:hypothetical protein